MTDVIQSNSNRGMHTDESRSLHGKINYPTQNKKSSSAFTVQKIPKGLLGATNAVSELTHSIQYSILLFHSCYYQSY